MLLFSSFYLIYAVKNFLYQYLVDFIYQIFNTMLYLIFGSHTAVRFLSCLVIWQVGICDEKVAFWPKGLITVMAFLRMNLLVEIRFCLSMNLFILGLSSSFVITEHGSCKCSTCAQGKIYEIRTRVLRVAREFSPLCQCVPSLFF